MANCDKRCPTFRQIEILRAKCLACNVCGDGNTFQANGRGAIYLDGAEDAEALIAHSPGKRYHSPEVYAEKEPERNVTALPADVEDALRQFAATFFGLKQVEINLLWHLANGGNLANFAETMERFKTDMAKYKHLDKRNAWAIFKHIGQVFAPFKALAGGLIGKGKGGAVKQAIKPIAKQEEFSFEGMPFEDLSKKSTDYSLIREGFDNGKCTTRKGTYRKFKTGDGRVQPTGGI